MPSLVPNTFPPRNMSMDEAVAQGFFFAKVYLENAHAMTQRSSERDELFAALQPAIKESASIPLAFDPFAAGTDKLQVQAALAQYDAYLRTVPTTIGDYACHCFYAFSASVLFSETYVDWKSDAAHIAYSLRLIELTSNWVLKHRPSAPASLDYTLQRVLGPNRAAILMPAPYHFLTVKFRHSWHGNWNVAGIKQSEGPPVFSVSCSRSPQVLEMDEDGERGEDRIQK
ncbi:hypothetical protein CPB85DRAFT_1434339 [Mucidula mucida]|nr:hypothetical protein CPB85DRAFT_1434339 [Mucidula mucida]